MAYRENWGENTDKSKTVVSITVLKDTVTLHSAMAETNWGENTDKSRTVVTRVNRTKDGRYNILRRFV